MIFLVRDKVRREITLIELHPLNHFERGFNRFGFFHRHRAIFAHLVQSIGDNFTDCFVPVGRDGRDLANIVLVLHFFADRRELFHNGFNRAIDSTLQLRRIRPGGHILETLPVDRFRQNRGGSSAVPRDIASFAGDFTDELGTDIFIRILEFDLFRDRHTVFGDGRRSELFIENHVATGRSECRFDGFGELLHAAQKRVPGGFVKQDLFGCHNSFPPSAHHAEDIILTHDQHFFAFEGNFCPAVFTKQDLVPFFNFHRDEFARVVPFSGSNLDYFPLLGFFFSGIGDDDPAFFHFLLFERMHQHPIAERTDIHISHSLGELLSLVLRFRFV